MCKDYPSSFSVSGNAVSPVPADDPSTRRYKTVSKCLEFRIRPDRDQQILIWKTFGCARFVWNQLLEERIAYARTHGWKLLNTTPAHLKESNPFLKEVDSLALANVQLNLNQACLKLFPKARAPRFRKKGKCRRAYTTNCVNGNIRLESYGPADNYIRLPKLGAVRIILHRSIPDGWKLKHATIKETAGGRFFVSLVFDAIVEDKPIIKDPVLLEAFDYSMPDFAVSASGEYDVRAEDTHWFRNLEAKIAREYRKLSRMVKDSANYIQQQKRIGRLCEKAAGRRRSFLHKLSKDVAASSEAVIIEDINLNDMSRMLHFGKTVYDNGFGIFRTMLQYKLRDQGKMLVRVGRFFPSSKSCSFCHHVNSSLSFDDRYWVCPECGAIHHRDINSCRNLIEEGSAMINRWASGDSSLILTPEGVLSEKKAPRRT